uniref:C2H2-type domain-containing protein n=1 Tax=Parascaris univalens TaxID=6257 RepID=A0A915BSP4_PARUN
MRIASFSIQSCGRNECSVLCLSLVHACSAVVLQSGQKSLCKKAAALRGLCSLFAIMGDAFDEEEDRLMIDDAMLDPSGGSRAVHPGTNPTTMPAHDANAIPHVIPFANSDDGVENHPIDPDPKTTFYNDGATTKVMSGALRDDLLKVTIRTTHSPMTTTFSSDKHLTDAGRSEESCKEEGEIDDEDESGGGAHAQHLHSASSALQQNALTWPAVEQNAGFEAVLNGTAKYGYTTTQQHEHHAVLSSQCAMHLPSHHLVVANLPLSSVDSVTVTSFTTLSSPSSPQATLISTKNVSAATVTDDSSTVLATALHRQPSQAASAVRPPPPLPQTKRVNEEQEETAKVVPATNSIADTAGTTCGTSSSSSKAKSKKKRRISEEESDGGQLTSAVHAGPSSNSALVNLTTETGPKRKKQLTRDRSSNVSTKSVQTNEDDVEVTVGSTHCLDFTVLAKVPGQTSDSLYFVTNWNGRELYGILGDGMPPLHQSFQAKRSCVNASSNGDANSDTSGASHDRSNGGTPSKQRVKSQRGNRTSSVCTPNGSSETKSSRKTAGMASVNSEIANFGYEMAHEEEMSQSPVSWLCAGGTDPLYGVGAGSIGTTSGLAQLREVNSAQMICCPVAGCGYYFDTHAQLSMHYPHHFNQFKKAIYTEAMGSQTDALPRLHCQDASTEPITELERPVERAALCNASTQTMARTTSIAASPCKDALRPQLSNSEERSIHELFQVARRTNPNESAISKREFVSGHDSGGSTSSKAFENRTSVGEVSKGTSMPTALDAMEKMVSEGSLSTGEGIIGSNFSSLSLSHANAVATTATGSMLPSTSLAGSSHAGAGSPVFSDISDDAPTLEKEVVDKAEDRSSERMKLLSSARSPLASLSLSSNSDKLCNVSATSGELSSTSLLCAGNVPSATSLSTNPSIRAAADPLTSTIPVSTLPDAKREQKTISASSSSSSAPLISFPPFVGLDPSSFPAAVRSTGVPGGGASVASMMYTSPYMMPFGMSPAASVSASGTAQSSSGCNVTSVTTKHKIHDLKAAALNATHGIAADNKDGTKMSPSMMASPGTRSPSSNAPSASAVAGTSSGMGIKSTSQQSTVAASSQTPPSRPVTFLVGQQPPGLQGGPDRGPNVAALMQQQQHQQQAHYLAQMQQQQQMQQYMSQMRFAGGFPMMPPANAAMAQQAYEQALVAMQAGMAPANFGLFAPQTFQPK